MLTFDSLPQVRVVRSQGQTVTPPPAPPAPRGAVGEAAVNVLAVAVGMWPVAAVMLLALGFLYLVGLHATS